MIKILSLLILIFISVPLARTEASPQTLLPVNIQAHIVELFSADECSEVQKLVRPEDVFSLRPNIKYEMLYEKESAMAGKILYRYHLKEPGKIKASDGFIALFKTDKNETDYIEYDFLDAEWGLGGIAGKTKLWSEVAEGILWSDLSIKTKSEKPALSAEDASPL